jgi:hypothetical protein
MDPADVLDLEFDRVPLGHKLVGGNVLETVIEADDGHPAVNGLDGRRADDAVNPRRGPAADDDRKSLMVNGHKELVSR